MSLNQPSYRSSEVARRDLFSGLLILVPGLLPKHIPARAPTLQDRPAARTVRTSTLPTRIAALPAIAFLVLVITSCSIFDTREPEEPGSTTVPVFIQPDRPQDVVQNLINAVRAVSVDNYRRCLSFEDFEYEPTSAAQSSNPDLWQGWGALEEETYFNNMRAETEGLSGHDLRFENESYTSRPDGDEQFEADYVIIINHNRQGVPSEARGRIRLIIDRDEDGQWAIHSWSDASDGSDFTWSDFRASFL